MIDELRPLCDAGEIDDQIDVVGRPDALERNRVGYVERPRAITNKDEPGTKLVAESDGHGFQHLLELALNRHPSLCASRSAASLVSR